jgi:hypothetical protein
MKALVKNWFKNGKSWRGGIILLQQMGYDPSVVAQIKAARNNYSMELLHKAMSDLLASGTKPELKREASITLDAMPDDKDQVLQAIKNEWLPKYTQMNILRHRLDPLLDDDGENADIKRGQIALEILELEQQCMAIWAKRDYYLAHGKLPDANGDEEEEAPVVDPFEAAKRIENLKIYKRRYRLKVEKDPTDSKAAELLANYSAELDKLLMHYEDRSTDNNL